MCEDLHLQLQSNLRELRNWGAWDGGASGIGERMEMGPGGGVRAGAQRQRELVHDSLLHIQYKRCLGFFAEVE